MTGRQARMVLLVNCCAMVARLGTATDTQSRLARSALLRLSAHTHAPAFTHLGAHFQHSRALSFASPRLRVKPTKVATRPTRVGKLSATRYPSRGSGRGGGRERERDSFESFGEELSFDTVANVEHETTAISSKRVSPAVLEALTAANITTFTPIQSATFDPLFEGRDMIGRSRTGTGKTLAFGLPICEVVARDMMADGTKNSRGRSPRVIILAPTRELAKQVDDQLSRVARPLGLWTRTIYGGSSYERQMRDLEAGFDILVGTPGRIMDHLGRGTLSLSNIKHVILDEADEMLKMGFADDIEKIFGEFDITTAQVLLFSATTPAWVQEIARQYLKNPINVDAVGTTSARTATTIKHIAVKVPDNNEARKNILEDVIAAHSQGGRVIVFTQTKADADDLSTSSSFAAENTRVLHGDISQRQREMTLKQFREGHFKVLIATDVAARGIDISEVDLVVQYKPPDEPDAYVHRSGRTGRAGREGTSVVMYSESEWFKLSKLEKSIQIKFERLGMPTIDDVVAGLSLASVDKIKGVDENVIPYFRDQASSLLAEGLHTPEEILARCLAAMTGRKLTPHRSLLTGRQGVTTLLVEADTGAVLKEWDVMEYVKGLYTGDDRLYVKEVKGVWNRPNAAIIDVDAEKAQIVLKNAREGDNQEMRLSVCTQLPRLDQQFNRGFERGGRGGDRRAGRGGDRFESRGGYGGGRHIYDKSAFSREEKGGRDDAPWSRGPRRGGGMGSQDFGNRRGGEQRRERSSSPRPSGPPKGDESLDKFLQSLDWP